MLPAPFRAGERPGLYIADKPFSDADALALAETIVRERLRRGASITSPAAARSLLVPLLGAREYEAFWVAFLDQRHRLLRADELFRGTIDGASVYPREVVKAALRCNAAAVIFAHNHPSGVAEASEADRCLTERLVQALALVDVRVLDHLVVGGTQVVSLAERGLV